MLFLQNNLLTSFPVWSLSVLPLLSILSLANNSWSCGCSFVRELQELTRSTLVRDASQLECVEFNFMGQEAVRVNIGTNTSCVNSLAVSSLPADTTHSGNSNPADGDTSSDILPLILGVLAAVLLLLAGGALLAYRHWRTRMATSAAWSSSSWSSRSSSSKASSAAAAAATPYEAVLCYADKDEEFMREIFIPNLAHCGVRHRRWRPQHDKQQPDLYLGLANSAHQKRNNCKNSGSISRTVIVLSRSFLAGGEWERLRGSPVLHSGPVLVLLEELTALELAAAPELNLLLATYPAIRWEEAGFWPKFLFYLPPSSSSSGHHHHLATSTGPLYPPPANSRSLPHNNNGGGGLNSDSSTASTKSTGTPREQGKHQQQQHHHGMMNPLEQWSDASDSGYGVTKDHIYQTLGTWGLIFAA